MILHSFIMGDVEDPYLMAASPIFDWQRTEKGQWVMEHVKGEAVFHIIPDPNSMGYRVVIQGELDERDEIIFRLKWS